MGQRLLSLFVIGFLLYFLLASPGEAGDTIQAAFEVAADLLGRLLSSLVTFLSNVFFLAPPRAHRAGSARSSPFSCRSRRWTSWATAST